MGSNTLGFAVFQIPIAFMSNSWNYQKYLSIITIINGMLYTVIPFIASRYGWIAVWLSRFLMGNAYAFSPLCCTNLLLNWLPIDERAKISKIYTENRIN